MVDKRVSVHEFDAEVDRKANEKLADMGINKPEDLGPGRGADLGQVSDALSGVDENLGRLDAEKIIRDQQFREMAGEDVQPTAPPEPAPATAPAQPDAAQRLLVAEQETADWKRKYGERESKLGEERRKVAERLARLESGTAGVQSSSQTTYQPQSAGYDPRLLGNQDPEQPLTGAQTATLLNAMATAWGAQLSAREQAVMTQVQETTRQMQGFDLTSGEEADLLENHTWLGGLARPAQMNAMRDLIGPVRDKTKPTTGVVAPQPSQQTADLQRQHIATTSFIEPSAQGSPQEQQNLGGADPVLAKKAARLKELLNAPGGSDSGEAEKLMNELSRKRL